MGFSQTAITGVTATPDGTHLLVAWTSTAPAGTTYQVYVQRRLAWYGTAKSALLPLPPSGFATQFDVGTVGTGEQSKNFAASLPAPPGAGARVTLAWQGGTFLGLDIAGFHVYAGTTPGGAVSYAAPVAIIPAYIQGQTTDGYGMGGYGMGGYGHAAGSYNWTSSPLAAGTWNFGIKAFDTAGNEGTAATTSATVAAPPPPPSANAAGRRLTYTYSASTHAVTLNWLP